MIKAILFDYGGIFVPDLDLGKLRDGIPYKKLMIYKGKIERIVARFEKDRMEFGRFCEKLTEVIGKDVSGLLRKVLIEEYTEKANLNQNMMELVKSLKQKGYRVGLISNMIKEHAEINRKKGNFELFRPVILSYLVGYRKPEKEIYEIAIEETKENSEEILYIDNKYRDVVAAKRCGVEGLLYKNPKQTSKDISKILDSDLSLFKFIFE